MQKLNVYHSLHFPKMQVFLPKINFPRNKTQSGRHMFTKEEDTYLLYLVSVFGTNQWNVIASLIGSRNARQCRERYKHYLSPHINNSPWTSEEDFILLSKYEQLGPRWAKIASFFNGRTDVAVKNRYTALLRENDSKLLLQAKPECQQEIEDSALFENQDISLTHSDNRYNQIFNDSEIQELSELFEINEIEF